MKALQPLLCNEMHQGALKKRNYTLDNPLSIFEFLIYGAPMLCDELQIHKYPFYNLEKVLNVL